MPLLPLPVEGALPGSGELPVSSIDDVLAILPSFLRPDDSAPVRDAILAALTELCVQCQDWAAYAAAQADILRATGVYQDEIGAYEHGLVRAGADNETYRATQLAPPAVVTPAAILAAANAILAPFTAVQARYMEQPDEWFTWFDNVQGPPQSYLYFDGTPSQSPDYLDRLYQSEAAQNGGLFCPGREPGGARVFFDDVGRLFLLRVPDLTALNAQDTPVYGETTAPSGLALDGFYVAKAGFTDAWVAYVLAEAPIASTLYQNLVNAVARIKGHSMRWILLVDPNLVS